MRRTRSQLCTATSLTSGQRCRNVAVRGHTLCHVHIARLARPRKHRAKPKQAPLILDITKET